MGCVYEDTAPMNKIPIVDPQTPVDYASGLTPYTYVCGDCGAGDCKLWREYNTFLNYQTLRCAVCAGKDQKRSVAGITSEGKTLSVVSHFMSDQIGMLMPAVPTAENDTYWGYTSVPEDGCKWWKDLPSVPGKGRKDGICFRTACDHTGATHYNRVTQKYYCTPCARRINEAATSLRQEPLCDGFKS